MREEDIKFRKNTKIYEINNNNSINNSQKKTQNNL